MGLRALNNYLIIEREEVEKYKGNLALPEMYAGAIEKVSPRGTIYSIGKDVKLDIKVGDKVYFTQFGGSEISLDGKKYLVINEVELLGIYD